MLRMASYAWSFAESVALCSAARASSALAPLRLSHAVQKGRQLISICSGACNANFEKYGLRFKEQLISESGCVRVEVTVLDGCGLLEISVSFHVGARGKESACWPVLGGHVTRNCAALEELEAVFLYLYSNCVSKCKLSCFITTTCAARC